MGEPFDDDRTVNTKHLKKIFLEGELNVIAVCAKFAHTAKNRLKINNLPLATWVAPTEYCCCGHPRLHSFYSAYFVVNGIINGITTPDGFTLKCADHKTMITSIYVKKKLKLSTVDLEELAKKNLSNLRKWVIELPEQLYN